MGNYLYLPIIALVFYSFLLCAFHGYRDNQIIRRFIVIIEANILWTLGSVLMRGEVGGFFEVWYHISLLGILILPSAMYSFIIAYIEEQRSVLANIAMVSIFPLYIFNIFTGSFLAPPQIVTDAQNATSFVYAPSALAVVLFIPAMLALFEMIRACVKICKNEMGTVNNLLPILYGGAVLLLGNALILLPSFSGIPLDIVSCNVNAIFLFYALYKKRLFKLSVLFSTQNYALLAFASTMVLFWATLDDMRLFISSAFSMDGDGSVVLIITLFLAIMGSIYFVLRKFLDAIFIKDEIKQSELLKDFSVKVSKSLKKDEILNELLEVIKETLLVRKVYIFLPNQNSGNYTIVKSGNPLHNQSFTFNKNNPIIKYLNEHSVLLYMKDFSRTIFYKSLWESEKDSISEFGLEYIVPLHNETELVGFVALSRREEKKEEYSTADLSFLTSVTSVASIALKNSILYEKACHEAQTDELTGLYNRKHFYSILEQQYELCHNQTLTLAILNVDDFKLYNQLYGNLEGDIALQNMANLIRSIVGEHGFVARYSGKEFAIILPHYDTLSAKELTEHICHKISTINQNDRDFAMKCLTVSAGICSIPYGAANLKQLLSNVDLAVYQVKRAGKNAISIYSEGVHQEKTGVQTSKKEHAYESYASTIYALTAAIDTKDHYTFQHSNNVAYYATELAKAYDLSEDSVEIIHEAALLHDIGKIGIPENILNKPGKLTDEEYAIMKGHAENAIGIIRHLPSLDYVVPAVIGHHERYDGQGYPRRIGGNDIPLSARILCIADTFDAMTSRRSYKDAMPVEKALFIITQEAGKQFDPVLSELFVRLVRANSITCQTNELILKAN